MRFGALCKAPPRGGWAVGGRALPFLRAKGRVFRLFEGSGTPAHPTPRFAPDQPDGSLLVRFRAGGALEMCWHLFTWGDHVEVLVPKLGTIRIGGDHGTAEKATNSAQGTVDTPQ